MPRPGPRPYECVRRAWHSDRHQPMRGSIIQQIFRFWVVLNLADSLRFDCVFLVLVLFVHFGELHTMCLIRVVNENHSPATKKNKEWQEKLPIVVLKAEEIMYSKANSEVFPPFSLLGFAPIWILFLFQALDFVHLILLRLST